MTTSDDGTTGPDPVRRLDDPDFPALTMRQAADLLGVQAAFLRSLDEQHAIVVVPRLSANLLGDSAMPRIAADQWGDTRIALPAQLAGTTLRSAFDSANPLPTSGHLALRDVLRDVPVNLLIATSQSQESHP